MSNRWKRLIYLPLNIIDELPEFCMRDEEFDEIDEMWRIHYDTETRKNRRRKKIFFDIGMNWNDFSDESDPESLDDESSRNSHQNKMTEI